MKKIFTLFAVALAFCSTTAFADSVVHLFCLELMVYCLMG